MKYVKIILKDNDKILQHYFLKAEKWDVPAGRIEGGETETQAARRELLERTGYDVPEGKLVFKGMVTESGEDFSIFEASIKNAMLIATPGEKGGYETKIRWVEEK